MKHIVLTASLLTLASLGSHVPAMAQTSPEACETLANRSLQQIDNGTFTNKRYSVKGEWSMTSDCLNKTISFSSDFKTKNGPDLKVFLSPKPIAELNGKSALEGALNIGVLKSSKGEQSYTLGHDIDLSAYQSVIIQCEAFSVLWGGFDLPVAD